MVSLGGYRTIEPLVDVAYANVARRNWEQNGGGKGSPHGVPWFVSWHSSQFPGDTNQACGRYAMYQMADALITTPIDRWLESVSDVGSAIEKDVVRRLRDDGRLCRSNQPGRTTDPDGAEYDEEGRLKKMPQMGFVDSSCWLTGSIDAPIMPFGYVDRPLIVELKSCHESQVDERAQGMRGCKEEHRRQLLCSLGLAHEFGEGVFLHPTEDRALLPPDDGGVYYVARDESWPGPKKTWEYFFSYDADFMEQGRAHLRSWRQSFLDDELPQTVPRKNTRSHPYGWRWSEGRCRFCEMKRHCRRDYDRGVTKISESSAVMLASMVREGYTYTGEGGVRDQVIGFWSDVERQEQISKEMY